MQLVIGNKNYSSWSMRPWILLKHFELNFEEIRIPLFIDGYQEILAQYSPTLRVPVLADGELRVWDSYSILEYVNDKYLKGRALPKDEAKRAICRSYCAEMHSGFFALRNELPMNIRARKNVNLSQDVELERNRIETLWSEAVNQYSEGGAYLFGDISLADCMYAPIAKRFQTYGITLKEEAQAYMERLLQLDAVVQWSNEAKMESETIEIAEIGEEK